MNINVPRGNWVIGTEGRRDWFFWFLSVAGASEKGTATGKEALGTPRQERGQLERPAVAVRAVAPHGPGCLVTGTPIFLPVSIFIWELSIGTFKQVLRAVNRGESLL